MYAGGDGGRRNKHIWIKYEMWTLYLSLARMAPVSMPVVAPADAVKKDVNELLSHVGWCLWGSSQDSHHVLGLFAEWRLWCAAWLQRVTCGQTGGDQLSTGGPLLRPHSLTSRVKAWRNSVCVCVSLRLHVYASLSEMHRMPVCRCIKACEYIFGTFTHWTRESWAVSIVSNFINSAEKDYTGKAIYACYMWMCLWERPSHSAHCSPLQFSTVAPWVVSEWFGHPLCSLSPPAWRRTVGPATQHRGPASNRLLSYNRDCLFHPTGDFPPLGHVVIFCLFVKTVASSKCYFRTGSHHK